MATQLSRKKGGALLATLRLKAGITQVQLARQTETSRSMIAQIEGGKRQPSRKLALTLCGAVHASTEDTGQLLLAYEMTPPPSNTLDQIAAVLRADGQLTSSQAEQIITLAQEAYERALQENNAHIRSIP